MRSDRGHEDGTSVLNGGCSRRSSRSGESIVYVRAVGCHCADADLEHDCRSPPYEEGRYSSRTGRSHGEEEKRPWKMAEREAGRQ